ncbi:hypothetical protein HZB00_00405 [Candidatus Woesearchaeota archaeon]|nr:hypothetical protein [Candidatus Woesearchaeota archaeon]
MIDIQPILEQLQKIRGLKDPKILSPEDRALLKQSETAQNIGVHTCLKRSILLVALHDETFRKPETPEVIEENGVATFPAVAFPELAQYQAITGSPSIQSHFYLVEKHYPNVENYATLLIGFDL